MTDIESALSTASPSVKYSIPAANAAPAAVKPSPSATDDRLTDRTRARRLFPVPAAATLPAARSLNLALAPRADIQSLPRHNPVTIAIQLISGNTKTASRGSAPRGGLWVSGDVCEALARLRWIAGPDAALISLDDRGRLIINETMLSNKSGADRLNSPEAPVVVTKYLAS